MRMPPNYYLQPPPPRRRSFNLGGCLFGCVVSFLSLAGVSVVFCFGLGFYVSGSTPKPPLPNFTPNPAQAQAFEQSIQQAVNNSANGQFNVAVNNEQVSSWLNLNVPDLQNDLNLQNLQVDFSEGRTVLYGEVDVAGFSNVGTQVDLNYSVDAAGQVQVSIADMSFGGLGVPGSVEAQLTQQIQSAIEQELNNWSGEYRIDNIYIANGQLIVEGWTNQ